MKKNNFTKILSVILIAFMSLYIIKTCIVSSKNIDFKIEDLSGNKKVLENVQVNALGVNSKYSAKEIVIDKDGLKDLGKVPFDETLRLKPNILENKNLFRGMVYADFYENNKVKIAIEEKAERNNEMWTSLLHVAYENKDNNKIKKFKVNLDELTLKVNKNIFNSNYHIQQIYNDEKNTYVLLRLESYTESEKNKKQLLLTTLDLEKETIELKKEINLAEDNYSNDVFSTPLVENNKMYFPITTLANSLNQYEFNNEDKNEINSEISIGSIDLNNYEVKYYNKTLDEELLKEIKKYLSKDMENKENENGQEDLYSNSSRSNIGQLYSFQNGNLFILTTINNNLILQKFDMVKGEYAKAINLSINNDKEEDLNINDFLVYNNKFYFIANGDEHYYLGVIDLNNNKELYLGKLLSNMSDYYTIKLSEKTLKTIN